MLCESCSHVAAILFKIEAAVRMGYTSLACTDQVCLWNKCFTKKIQPERIAQIKFFRDKAKQRLQCKKTTDITPATEQQQETLLKQLAKCSKPPIALSSFSGYCEPFSVKTAVPAKEVLPADLRTLYQPTAVPGQLDELIARAQDSMRVTEAEVAYLEKTTRNQSSSVVWHQMRCGRITASTAYQFLHTDPHKPAESLVKKICIPGQRLSVPSVNWGISNEKNALQSFSDAFSQIHNDVKVSNTGMRLSLDEPFLGASPDALALCSCCGSSVVEIKCPYVFRDIDLGAMYQDARCCLTADNTLKSDHQYYAQVQVQMHVFQVSAAQFVMWTPNFTIITKVERDDEFIAEMLDRLKLMWPAHVLPELITRRLETRQHSSDDSQNSDFTYCYCKEDIGGQMIGCDNPSCHIKWFHLSCLKRKTVPKGSWYCKTCKPKAS